VGQFAGCDLDARTEPDRADERDERQAEEEMPPPTHELSPHLKAQYTLVT
jgi:hypothetical protein